MPKQKFYAICSGPDRNYEGKVFTIWEELVAYRRGKQGPKGKTPWFKSFTHRAEAYRFAGIPDPGRVTQLAVARRRELSAHRKAERYIRLANARNFVPERHASDDTITKTDSTQKTNPTVTPLTPTPETATTPSTDNAMNPCPVCMGE